ncbi:malonate decarboxylase alpha subunit [Xylophilus ampelinus]|uniref:Malonate decarboxylase alpha subunit n=1 Tax=Xylophilus ampelinus TaxID=54067 RepID=A0A318SFR6_9BURK|nr:malonate decarboxylase alpha subunit [Xylophilus ampelinus]
MQATPSWNLRAQGRATRLARVAEALGPRLRGKVVADATAVGALLEAVIEPHDRVCLEGNNQKQADFLADALVALDPQRVHHLHMVQSVLALPQHLDVFENGVASRLDFSFSGPQGARLAQLASAGRIEIGAIHTYLALFARYFVDLTPHVALVAAQAADAQDNLYTGPNTEDTPAIVEATAFSGGIVIAQVDELVDGATTTLPRIDIPADWVSFVVPAPRPHFIEPLFTRDPAQISEIQVLMAMVAIDRIVMSDVGRLAMSGPEVIEASHGMDEFDARDRALVWRTTGGKHRWLTGDCDRLVEDAVAAFRAAALALLEGGGASRPVTLDALEAEHALLAARLREVPEADWAGDGGEAERLWRTLGVPDPARVPALDVAALQDAFPTPRTA